MPTDLAANSKPTTPATVIPGSRWLPVAESLLVFALIMAYIWRWRYTHPYACIPILAGVILSQLWRRETTIDLGLTFRTFSHNVKELAPAVVFIALTMVSLGLVLQSTRNIPFDQGVLALCAYCPWGLVQQYLLNGYFTNRLTVMSARTVPVASAVLFAGVHSPNWFLMVVTLAAGYCSSRIFLKYRNLYRMSYQFPSGIKIRF